MRKLLLFVTMMCVAMLGITQSRTITGRVLDEAGQPVSGASIIIRGTNTGASANSNGNFTINAKTGDVLVISAVGIPSKEVKVSSGSSVSVSLARQSESLSEVVVTAYGIKRNRNQLAYAAQTVSGEEVSKTRGSNFVTNLSGKVAGLEIRQPNTMGASTNVILRGSKSFFQSSQALFVVDGVPVSNQNNNTLDQRTGRGGYDYGNAAADINPDDIESMTVLKGAASSALYGSQGANGVILITTKKGKRGLGITVNSGVSQSSILRNTFPKYQKKYGAGYGSYLDAGPVNGDTTAQVAPTYDDASWGTKFDPSLMVYQWDAFDPSSPNFGKPRPWVAAQNDPSAFFEKPLSFNNSVFLQSGNEKGSIALGYTRNNEKGVLPNSSIIKDLLNFSATYNLTTNLSAGASANYSRINGKGRFGTGYDGANALNLMTNFREWWQVNADLKELKQAYERTGKNVTWNMHSGPTGETQPEFWDNPYFSRYQSYETDSRDRYFGNVYLNYKPVEWLNLLARVSMDSYSEFEQERKAVGTVGVPFYRRFNQSYNEYNYDFIANGDWNVTQDLNVKALLGSNTRERSRNNIDASTTGGLVAPGIYTIANSLSAPSPPFEQNFNSRIEGVFAGATLSYKNTYVLDATLRRDRSSTLPKGNNVYYYPSISGGFIFSQLLKSTWLSYGKLRANYAEVGNDAPEYAVNQYYESDLDPNTNVEVTNFNGVPLFSAPRIFNSSILKPERTKSFELGLEASFFRSRLGFDVAYYDAKTVNQIIPLTVSTATGYSKKYVNSGTIQNKGIELSLYGTPVKTRDFVWDISVNFTRNRNKVTELFSDIDNLVLASFQGSISLNATLNEPYGTIHGTDYVYTNGQKTVDADGNYIISPTNNLTIGNVNPDWIGGVSNRFTYKGFSLSALIDVRHGGSVFSTDMYYALAGGLYEETAEGNVREPLANGGGIIREGVTEDGKPNTTKVSLSDEDEGVGNTYGSYDSYVSAPDRRFVYDASYVKLREVTIGYSLPSKLFTNSNFIKGIDLSLIGRNLAILHKNLPYADPEDSFGSGNLQGVQTGSYPAVRSMGFNLKVKF